MQQEMIYQQKGHKSFVEDWLPHRDASDMWCVQGLFSKKDEANRYAFRLTVKRIDGYLGGFTEVDYAVINLCNGESCNDRVVIPRSDRNSEQLFIDRESIIFEEKAQILIQGNSMAVRLRGDDFGLDLLLDYEEEYWYGDDGLMFLNSANKRRKGALYYCILPQMQLKGRLYLNKSQYSVQGTAAFERLWGFYPLRRTRVHWEHFFIFMDNGDAFSISDFPYGKYRSGICLPKRKQPFVMGEYEFRATEDIELDDWRFSAAWHINIDDVSYRLHPIAAQQHHLPLTRLIAEVCGDDGEHKGYAFAELLPGARNELDRINLKMYYEKLHRPEKTIISAAVEDDQTNTTVLQTDDEVQLKNEEDSMTQIVELDAEPELMSLPDNSFNESENIIDRSAENEGIDA